MREWETGREGEKHRVNKSERVRNKERESEWKGERNRESVRVIELETGWEREWMSEGEKRTKRKRACEGLINNNNVLTTLSEEEVG